MSIETSSRRDRPNHIAKPALSAATLRRMAEEHAQRSRTGFDNLPAYKADELEQLGSREAIRAALDELHPVERAQVRTHLNWNRRRRLEERQQASKRVRP